MTSSGAMDKSCLGEHQSLAPARIGARGVGDSRQESTGNWLGRRQGSKGRRRQPQPWQRSMEHGDRAPRSARGQEGGSYGTGGSPWRRWGGRGGRGRRRSGKSRPGASAGVGEEEAWWWRWTAFWLLRLGEDGEGDEAVLWECSESAGMRLSSGTRRRRRRAAKRALAGKRKQGKNKRGEWG